MICVRSLIFAALLALPFATAASAQSTDDIVKRLVRNPKPEYAPQPGFKSLPFGQRGVTIVEPQEERPPSIDLYINFEYNSDKLTPDAIRILRRLGEALKDQKLAEDRFKIAGHTDGKGTAQYNLKLSDRRAQAVRDYLIFQYDMDPARLEAAGFGMTQLADPSRPEDGINRRVQVINAGATTPKGL